MLHKVNCKHCDRYLFDAITSVAIQGLICPNSKCKARLNIKVVFTSDQSHSVADVTFTEKETPPRIAPKSVANS